MRPARKTLLVTLLSACHSPWVVQLSCLLHPVQSFVHNDDVSKISAARVVPRQLLQHGRRCCHGRPTSSSKEAVVEKNTLLRTSSRSSRSLIDMKGSTKDLVSDEDDDDDEDFFRTLDSVVPYPILYLIRDSGLLRLLADLAILCGAPSLQRRHPSALGDLLRLLGRESALSFLATIRPLSHLAGTSSSSSLLNVTVQHERLVYGDHPSQYVRMVSPSQQRQSGPDHPPSARGRDGGGGSSSSTSNKNRVLIFVHGGAWGSGFPTMYLLAITPFVNRGYTCCVVGYRTYPDAGCLEQAQDVASAVQRIQTEMQQRNHRPNGQQHQRQEDEIHDYTILAHSSGTHICSLAFVKGLLLSPPHSSVNRFIGLAGVFDIPQHYQFERRRGVARFSPMAPACGVVPASVRGEGHGENNDDSGRRRRRRRRQRRGGEVLKAWRNNSPLYCLLTTSTTMANLSYSFPRECYFVHGALDTTCPSTYTEEFGRALQERSNRPRLGLQQKEAAGGGSSSSSSRRIQVDILPTVEHAGMVLDLMFGGPTLDVVLSYLNVTTTSSPPSH
jgi:hypothetical protein